jgi:subtilisin family serine protease
MRRYRVLAMLAALVVAGLVGIAPAWADRAPATVKYYRVQATYRGRPEQLGEVAQRFLGAASRAQEIFDLNDGRAQPDGGRLTDATAALHPGWLLVLPWDAIGDGIVLGPLPTAAPAPAGHPTPPSPSATPTPAAGNLPADAVSTCAALPAAAAGRIPWPQLRLAPDQAWGQRRGGGVTVAVIDTGVNAATPALAGRIIAGVTVGTAPRAGVPAGASCQNHGTGMAGIVAAQPMPGRGLVGIAPGATIFPVTVDLVGGGALPAQVTNALAAAVDAKVGVAMLALPVNLDDPGVSAALADAVAHNVVVVVSAAATMAAPHPGVLRVGAVTADDRLARSYSRDAVDVLAPGDAVVTLAGTGDAEIEGSGTDFAVPFVAGLAALVRSAAPALSAEDVAQRVELTADRGASIGRADPTFGWGIIDPAGAVSNLGHAPARPAGPESDLVDPRLLIAGGIVLVLAAGLVVRRRHRFTPARQ